MKRLSLLSLTLTLALLAGCGGGGEPESSPSPSPAPQGLAATSRAAIEGGLNPSVSYTLNDSYAGLIEDCRTTSALTSLARTMMDDFIQRVQQSKAESGVSPQIQAVCDYISMHPKEKFSIADFAKRCGYTEYYFSHKFKQETGTGVVEYIRRAKIDHARLLLAGTRMGIQEISDELGFASRSYFSSTFQKETGISPSEYRRRAQNQAAADAARAPGE